MTFRLAILADDLTGALDTAEPFARAGASVMVATSVDAAARLPFAASDVVAVNVDSRHLPAAQAAQAVRQAWAHIAHWQPDCLFKKVDSRMKGNAGAEIAALMTASGRRHVLAAPAIPAIGRFTQDGTVTGFGVEHPIRIAALPGWLADWDVRDCTSTGDMAEIAQSLIAAPKSILAAGCSGLAEALANLLYHSAETAKSYAAEERMLMVIGSRDPITLAQIEALGESDLGPLIIHGEESPASRAELILLLPQATDQSPEMVAKSLAALALKIARQEGISTVLLSGGDTASAFITHAGIDLLAPSGSLAQGMPIAQGEAHGKRWTLITKSGGFGDPDALATLFRMWRDGRS